LNYAGAFGSGGLDSHSTAQVDIDSLSHRGAADSVTIPDAHLLFAGDYERSGTDLIVSDRDHRVVVANYFQGDKRPTLVSPDGAALDPKVIEALTGHVQYAQASGAATAAKVVGHVIKMTGSASVVRNGVTLIVSILGARDQWGDTKKLLEYGFDNYQTLETQPAGKTSISERVSVRPEHISASIVTPQEDIKSKPSDAYLLQVGSFRERDRAESLVKQFSADGFEAFVETISLTGGQTTYRVRVGPYAELLEAQEIAQEILHKSGLRVLILPAPAARQTEDNPS